MRKWADNGLSVDSGIGSARVEQRMFSYRRAGVGRQCGCGCSMNNGSIIILHCGHHALMVQVVRGRDRRYAKSFDNGKLQTAFIKVDGLPGVGWGRAGWGGSRW